MTSFKFIYNTIVLGFSTDNNKGRRCKRMEMCHFNMWNLNNSKKRRNHSAAIAVPVARTDDPVVCIEHADRQNAVQVFLFRYIAAEVVLPYSFYFIISLNRVDMSTSMKNKNKHFTVAAFVLYSMVENVNENKNIYKNTAGTRVRCSLRVDAFGLISSLAT